jgi:hypothetical protein
MESFAMLREGLVDTISPDYAGGHHDPIPLAIAEAVEDGECTACISTTDPREHSRPGICTQWAGIQPAHDEPIEIIVSPLLIIRRSCGAQNGQSTHLLIKVCGRWHEREEFARRSVGREAQACGLQTLLPDGDQPLGKARWGSGRIIDREIMQTPPHCAIILVPVIPC